jgi:hypothetical protein
MVGLARLGKPEKLVSRGSFVARDPRQADRFSTARIARIELAWRSASLIPDPVGVPSVVRALASLPKAADASPHRRRGAEALTVALR